MATIAPRGPFRFDMHSAATLPTGAVAALGTADAGAQIIWATITAASTRLLTVFRRTCTSPPRRESARPNMAGRPSPGSCEREE